MTNDEHAKKADAAWRAAGGRKNPRVDPSPSRESGGVHLRYEDFTPLGLARMAKERPALYGALKREIELRRDLAFVGFSVTAPDGLIDQRITAALKVARPETVRHIRELVTAWRTAIGDVDRVSPTDFSPSAA